MAPQAANAANDPRIQEAARAGARAVGASASAAAEAIASDRTSLAWYVAAGVAATLLVVALVGGAFFIGGGLAGFVAWPLARRCEDSRRFEDLDALAKQIVAGGVAAQHAAAHAIDAEPADVAEWAAEWQRAADGPKRGGRRRQCAHSWRG